MQEFFRHLPSPLILGTLVGIFISIYRHNRTSRVRFWIVAWALVFVHFLVPILEIGSGRLNFLLDAIDSTTLQWAGLAFVFSLAPLRLSERNRWLCFVAVAVPLGAFAYLATSQSGHKLPQAICLAVISLESMAIYVLFASRREWMDSAAEFFVFGVGTASIWQLYHGNPDGPYNAVLMATYALAGIFVIRHYWRPSPGVLVTSIGLFAWAAVWCGAAYFMDGMMRLADGGAEIWNVPKFIVAFGMILVLLEDESLAAQSARDREYQLNRQMERFAEITSQLLSAVEVLPFCEKIAKVITEESNFARVVVLLADDSHRLLVAGHSGLGPVALEHVQQLASRMNLEEIPALCNSAPKIAKNSYLLAAEKTGTARLLPAGRRYSAHARWHQGDQLLVPLKSPRGLSVGCFFLDEPKDLDRIGWEELSKIELLAADLAVAMDRMTMHKQMIQREKLVGIGQLVSGVAHELNNPLTAVLGYTELMGDYPLQAEVVRDLGIVRREANRMKRIIENLLRFSRQSRSETTTTDFSSVLQDVLALREYDFRAKGITLATELPQELPNVAIDQSQLKIVLTNLIANAIDAVVEADTKRVKVAARDLGDKLLVNITDSGPGFRDLNRIFDPFFTTKSPGRGMGLGLSICYGIMRQHGGGISASNVHPTGACVSLEMLTVSALKAAEVAG